MIFKLQPQSKKKKLCLADLAVSDSFYSSAVSNGLKTDLFCSLHNNIWVLWGVVFLGVLLCFVLNAAENLLQCCTLKYFSCLSNFYCDAMHSLSTEVVFQDLEITVLSGSAPAE